MNSHQRRVERRLKAYCAKHLQPLVKAYVDYVIKRKLDNDRTIHR